ncbi:MAG TPA: protein-L-isoaspartate(D-aspartate) O-methyltransferase [Saprospiraceae bacterium]|nr:protein-L-isoaspartate(D-aspartate) O-methyltransferase [Saprospiraceae bacterium]
MQDYYKMRGLRQSLISKLRSKGIRDERILSAFWDIPRHYFIDKEFAHLAYEDIAFPIDSEQTISQPFTVATQTVLLDIKENDKVLEIGTGSGFQAAVLAYLGAKVYTIERQEKLFKKTHTLLKSIGYERIRTLLGDGYEGSPRFAPFDKIIVTAGANNVPIKLIEQLKEGGVMVIPVGVGDVKKMWKITKIHGSKLKREIHGDFSFVPFLEGVNSL